MFSLIFGSYMDPLSLQLTDTAAPIHGRSKYPHMHTPPLTYTILARLLLIEAYSCLFVNNTNLTREKWKSQIELHYKEMRGDVQRHTHTEPLCL